MALIRIPFPKEPDQRQALFAKVVAAAGRHGSYEGTTEEGTFLGKTPIGEFAGSYRYLEHPGELELVFTRKPWLVPTQLIEHEIRRFVAKA